jgi:peptidoglycan/LPS O-acetylase OafA/YrhL
MSSSSTILSRKASLLPGTSPGRVPELDGLRGVAISLVIVFHYVASAEHRGLNPWLHRALTGFAFGWSGVDLFFILSGFLIGGILLDARSSPTYFRAFYMRRVFRILPLYYAWTLLFAVFVALALWLAPGRFPITTADLAASRCNCSFSRTFSSVGHMRPSSGSPPRGLSLSKSSST